MSITVAVAGAKGRMGQEVVAAVQAETDLRLVAQVDMGDDLAQVLQETKPMALVDFTVPKPCSATSRSRWRRASFPSSAPRGCRRRTWTMCATSAERMASAH